MRRESSPPPEGRRDPGADARPESAAQGPPAPPRPARGEMTTAEAGRLGGQRVKRLIAEGKEAAAKRRET